MNTVPDNWRTGLFFGLRLPGAACAKSWLLFSCGVGDIRGGAQLYVGKDELMTIKKSGAAHQPLKNQLLAALPSEVYQRLLPHLKHVSLNLKETLCQAGETMQYAYFPLSGMISMLSLKVDGANVEVGVIGHEGMLGLPIFLGGGIAPNQAIGQGADGAMRMKAKHFSPRFPNRQPATDSTPSINDSVADR